MRLYKNGREVYQGGYKKKSDYEYIPASSSAADKNYKSQDELKREYKASKFKLVISTLTSLAFIDLFVYCILVFFSNDIVVEKCIWMAYTCVILMSICIFCILLMVCNLMKKQWWDLKLICNIKEWKPKVLYMYLYLLNKQLNYTKSVLDLWNSMELCI